MVRRLFRHLKIYDVIPVARRWFITNAFDGTLSILGLILGANAAGQPSSNFIVGAGLGVSLALAISQSTGNLMTERAERIRELKQLESHMLTSLENTIHKEAAVTAPIIAGILGGVAPAAYASLALIPYVMEIFGLVDFDTAFYASIVGVLLSVFFLGVILGRVSRTNLLISGLKMAGIGMLTAAILLFIGVL